MTVEATDLFSVEVTITTTNLTTGKANTTTSHMEHEVDYGAMQAIRGAFVGGSFEKLGEMAMARSISFGQVPEGMTAPKPVGG